MFSKIIVSLKSKFLLLLFIGVILGITITLFSHKALEATSTDKSCEACHVHPHVFDSWKLSVHHDTKSGTVVHCVDCHLPPKGQGYLKEKTRLGLKDLYGYMFKDSASFNWEAKSTLEQAQHFTFKESCINCHVNLFPLSITKEGQDAHLYYTQKEDELRCINCHLNVGHYDPNAIHAKNVDFGTSNTKSDELYEDATKVESHESFIENIPNTSVAFKMMAIPGGTFKIGNLEDEKYENEIPVKTVSVSPFFMAEIETSWESFLAFYGATAAEGRSTDTEGNRSMADVDAISGPTPPYGQPDQNWGLGNRPAITMSFHAAETYCKWLTSVAGKKYRLPTEAEWEYASRAGSATSYFFEGKPKEFEKGGFIKNILGKENTNINNFVVYDGNSQNKTQEPEFVEANAFGLKNMLGNAAEYCSDWYAPDAYTNLTDDAANPKGPSSGSEHVVRGGSFKSTPADVRCSSRNFTKTEMWLKSDPQMPKSIWWLSDCNFIGFRVVCEFDESTGNKSTKL